MCDGTKVEVEELESLLGPEDSEVDFRRILEEARNKKGLAISETFSSEGPSEFLVVRARRDEHRRKLRAQKEVSRTPPMLQQNLFSSANERQWQADLEEQRSVWSSPERKVIAAREDFLEKCIEKSGDCGFGAFVGARTSSGLPEVHSAACMQRG